MTDSPIPRLDPYDPANYPAPGEAPPIPIPPLQPEPEPPTEKSTLKSHWQKFPSNPALLLSLTLLTALAAFFRFWRLSWQCYWTDESYTISRIEGSFHHLLNSLSNQGFPPGWYVLLRWWTMAAEFFTHSNVTPLAPESTRALTALIGTLTVPAMYFLARQFTDRKGALLVTLLTAVNPYLIYYSRDIKMYPALWLFVILNTALFFKWQTTRKHRLWFPLFVITGFLMTAMHSTAWFMVALQLIFLLTRPRIKPFDAPLWLLAASIMALLPIYWYLDRTTWLTHAMEGDGENGLSWIPVYTNMSWNTLASLPCSHLLGYLWPSYPPDKFVRGWFSLGHDFDAHTATRAWPQMAKAQLYTAIGFAAVLILGLLPWRGFPRRSPERRASVTRYRFWWIALWIILPTLCLALTWIPPDSPWHERIWHSIHIQPLWEPRYLGFLVPAWILWLAASLRRFPTWPLRTLLILAVSALSAFSALSNHLLYRNPPFQIAAQIAAKYYDPDHKNALAVGHIDLNYNYPGQVLNITYELASNTRPFSDHSFFFNNGRFDANTYAGDNDFQFLNDEVLHNRAIRTLVLTDRDGDITDPNHRYSNESMAKVLGPNWTLVEEKTYQLHYEWRFYIYNTWRTRVWKRTPSHPPASQPKPADGSHP